MLQGWVIASVSFAYLGVLFALDEAGLSPAHSRFGAYGRLISAPVHPDPYDPAIGCCRPALS